MTNDSKPAENLAKALWTLSWPVVTLNLLNVVNALLDRFFIGTLPRAALTAHGAAVSVIFMLFSLAFSVGIGAGAIISRAYGAKDYDEVKRGADQAVRVSVYVGLGLGLTAALTAPLAAKLILPATSVEAQTMMVQFLLAYSVGLPAMCINQTLAAALRSIGNSVAPMFLAGIQVPVHIALNYLLVYHFRLGLLGAGISLSASVIVSLFCYFLYARRSVLQAHISLKPPSLEWFTRILKISMPSGFQAILRTLSLLVFTLVLSSLNNGEAAIAAMTTGFAIEMIMFAPAFGISAAVSALVGQSLGAKDPKRAESIGWIGAMVAFLIAAVVSAPIYFAVPSFAHSLVGSKPDVQSELVSIVRFLCVTEPLFCLAMVLNGGLQGAGETKHPLWISIISLWLMRVPLAAILALSAGSPLLLGINLPIGLALGAKGAWIAMSVTQGVQGFLCGFSWRKGHWKVVKV
jgi:putative MATE family efflux protein